MNLTKIKKIPQAEEIIQACPLSDDGCRQVAHDRQEVKDIIAGRDKRFLVILGPCSAWPSSAVLEYAKKLKTLSEKVNDKIKLVMRVYIQKPRTTKGWTGPVNQPDPFLDSDVEAGIKYTRKMMVDVIEMGLPIADEALFTHNAKGFLELISWLAIGARSTEDQEHRIFASAVDCAVGMKNPTSGVVEIGVNGIVAVQYPHVAVYDRYQVETKGNEYAHLILRGGKFTGPNYHVENLREAKEHLEKHNVKNPAIIVDASHDNCIIDGKKDCLQQVNVVHELIDILEKHPDLKPLVKGVMIESFLKTGNQKVNTDNSDELDLEGLSITDPCIGWEETEKLILDLANRL